MSSHFSNQHMEYPEKALAHCKGSPHGGVALAASLPLPYDLNEEVSSQIQENNGLLLTPSPPPPSEHVEATKGEFPGGQKRDQMQA